MLEAGNQGQGTPGHLQEGDNGEISDSYGACMKEPLPHQMGGDIGGRPCQKF